MHLLVVREGAEINAYDLASTQGTYLGRKVIRCTRLPDQGSTTLLLGNTADAVRFAWRGG